MKTASKDATPSPLRLTTSGYWLELEEQVFEGKMSAALADCLKELIPAHQRGAIPPVATPHLIKEAAEHLADGILLSDSACDKLYDVMVVVPTKGHEETWRYIFTLIRRWPHGELKYPKDIEFPSPTH